MANQVPLFPIKPNWSGGVAEEFEFATEIISSSEGREQRRALRLTPRRNLSFDILVKGAQSRNLDRLLKERLGDYFILAHPCHYTTLTEPLSALGTVLTPDDFPEWIEADRSVVLVNGDAQEIVDIESVDSSSITATGGVVNAWPTGTRVYMAFRGRLVTNPLSLSNPTNTLKTSRVRFLGEPGYTFTPEDVAAGTTFNDLELFLKKPNWSGSVNVDFTSLWQTIDHGFGRIDYSQPVDFDQLTKKANYLSRDFDQVEEIVSMFLRMKGQRGELYAPTWTNDLEVTAALTSAGTTFTVDGIDHARAFDGDTIYKAVYVALRDGTYLTRLVSSVAAVGDDSVFTVSQAWGADIALADILFVSWMPVWRMAGDVLTIEWQSDQVAQFSLSMTALEALVGS